MNIVPLGSAFRLIRNGMNVRQDKSGDGLPITRIETISAGTIDPTRVGFAGLREGDCKGWLLETGDILFSHINSVEHLGKTAVYEGVPDKIVHGMNLLCLRTDPDKLHPRYAHYAFKSEQFRSQFSKCIKKAVNQASVSIGDLSKIRLTLPTIAEQRRIAAILDAADALRAKRRAALAKLDTLAQSIFIEMFGDPVANEQRWRVQTLGDVIPQDRPLTYGILMPGDDQADGVPYVRVVDMKDGGIDLRTVRRTTREISNQYRRSLLEAGDLIISIRGHVGRTAIVPPDLQGANITQDTARIASRSYDLLFVQELLRHRSAQHWMARRTKGAAVKGINLGDLRQLPIITPKLAEQRRFAERCSAVAGASREMRQQAIAADSLFASLQHRAFTGKL